MNSIRVALTAVLATAAMLAGAAVALAAPGQITSNVNVRTGPGTGYAVVGVLRVGTSVDVRECASGWCYVSGQGPAGWVSATYVGRLVTQPQRPAPNQPAVEPGFNFGLTINSDGSPNLNFGIGQPQPQTRPVPRPEPVPEPRPIPRPEPVDDTAQACFYTGTDFTGRSFCVEQGDSLPRLTGSWDDIIRSVEIIGDVTVDICTDNNYYGSCQTVTRSRSRLAPQIDQNVSSLEVY